MYIRAIRRFPISRYISSPCGNLLEIFLLPRFLPYRLTRAARKFLSINSSLEPSRGKFARRGKTRIPRVFRTAVFSTKFFLKTLIRRDPNGEIVSRWDYYFHLGFSLIASTSTYFLFFSFFSLEKRERTRQSKRIYSRVGENVGL